MLRAIFRVFLFIFAYLALPVGAFYLGCRFTDEYFRSKLIPLPFDQFGWAVGGAAFFWTLALVQAIKWRTNQ